MSEQAAFQSRAQQKATDGVHRQRLLRVINNYDVAVDAMKANQFIDWRAARTVAARVKNYALANLPELLEAFEASITARGAKVLWARDVREAQQHIMDIVARHGARRVVKSKSMTTEEIELNELLEEQGLDVLESDLGELIVQLAHEKPYHIVTPAMHKSKRDISELFHEKLNSALSDDAQELTQVAREHLRLAYVKADIGFTGANFILARDGGIAITENEGNARLSTACPPVHVAIGGIEKLLPSSDFLPLFWPLLATSGTGQQITAYSSIIRGPRQPGEADGPEHMYVVLIDNGRSRLYADEAFRESLRCIRCGACLNACPVYRTVGGHTYNTPYSGPIGAVITPQLKGLEEWGHLAFASSLCGACSDSCPVKIPLHHLLLENRQRALAVGQVPWYWRWAMSGWALASVRRSRTELLRPLARWASGVAAHWFGRSSLPEPARRSFSERWRAGDLAGAADASVDPQNGQPRGKTQPPPERSRER